MDSIEKMTRDGNFDLPSPKLDIVDLDGMKFVRMPDGNSSTKNFRPLIPLQAFCYEKEQEMLLSNSKPRFKPIRFTDILKNSGDAFCNEKTESAEKEIDKIQSTSSKDKLKKGSVNNNKRQTLGPRKKLFTSQPNSSNENLKKQTTRKTNFSANVRPLIDVDEAEELLIKPPTKKPKLSSGRAYNFKPPSQINIRFSKASPISLKKQALNMKDKTPSRKAQTPARKSKTPTRSTPKSSKKPTPKIILKSAKMKESTPQGKKIARKTPVKTPKQDNSANEFEEMEKLCGIEYPDTSDAQINDLLDETSSITSDLSEILENSTLTTLMNQNSAKKTLNLHKFITNIKSIIEKDRREFEEFKKAHAERIVSIKKILKVLENATDTDSTLNKENISPRRSIRNANQSPTIQKQQDLRVSTLKKNLGKSVTFNVVSPVNDKKRKALKLYNSMRNNCSMLYSPKPEGKESLKNTPKKVLSNKVQQQCLILQATPAHK